MKHYTDFPLQEILLRKYEKPQGNESERALLKRFCLSIGLLQPGDSRDIIVDVFAVLLGAAKKKELLTSKALQKRVIAYRQEHQLPLLGVASSNLRRQLRRLRELFFVEKIKNTYRITEFLSLEEIIEEKIIKYMLPGMLARIKEYAQTIDQSL